LVSRVLRLLGFDPHTGDPGPAQYVVFHQYFCEKVPRLGFAWSMYCSKLPLPPFGPATRRRKGGGNGGLGREGRDASTKPSNKANPEKKRRQILDFLIVKLY